MPVYRILHLKGYLNLIIIKYVRYVLIVSSYYKVHELYYHAEIISYSAEYEVNIKRANITLAMRMTQSLGRLHE